jgi:hypothetical protein
MSDPKLPMMMAAQYSDLPIPGTFVPVPSRGKSLDEAMRGISQELSEKAIDGASSVAEALMAPGNALQGQYNQVEINPDGSVNPVNSALIAQALNMAATVGVGGSAFPRPHGSLGMGGKEEVLGLLEQARARIAARDAKAAAILESGQKNVRMMSPTQGTALIGPDMSVPGKFRVTYFDPQGVPNGHVELPTYEDAIKRAILDGFSE